MESMTDILKESSEKEPEKPQPEATPEPEVQEEKPRSRRKEHLSKEYEAQGRDPDTGQYIPKEDKELPKEEPKAEIKPELKAEVKPSQQELTEKERAFLRGLEEERRKRQDLERQIAELRKPQTEAEKKTFWDDPEGHLKTHEEKLAARERNILLNVSEKIARSKYTDFDEKIEVFAETLKTPAGPGIHAQFMAAPDPAEFAYNLGKHIKEVRDAGSIDTLRERIAKEERQKMEAEFKKKQDELEKQRQELPSSLSDVKGAARKSVPVWTGPTSFDDILKP